MSLSTEDIAKKLKDRCGEDILESNGDGLEHFVRVEPSAWPSAALFLRDECGMDYLSCLTSVDRGADGLEAIYHLEHMGETRTGIVVRIHVPLDNPVIPTVENVWRTADWHEREAFDLMGIIFEGHHNLVRILCAEDWEGHALRKNYKSPDTYHGIKNNVV